MKWTLIAAILFLPLAANGATARNERTTESMRDRRVAVTARARRVTHDRLGNNWVFHGLDEVPREVKAAAVTLVRPDQTTRTFLASDLLARGSVFPGNVGQVYSISPLTTPGYYAATIGYISRAHYTLNALVVFAWKDDGDPQTVRVIQLRNSAQVIGGPRDTMIVTAVDPLSHGSFAMATVFDAEGNVHDELIPFGVTTVMDASVMVNGVRLQQSGADDFAIYDPQFETVQHYSLVSAGELPRADQVKPSLEMRQPRAAAFREIELAADWSVRIEDSASARRT